MQLSAIRSAVRDQLDLPDEEDIPTSLIDLYIEEGVTATLNQEVRWPFLEASWTVNTTEGVSEIALSPDIRNIVTVIADDGTGLGRIDHGFAEANFALDSTGYPALFSLWGNSMYLWPAPEADAPLTYTIRGYRKPNTMDGVASASPDMDERFHPALVHYACHRAYAQQEDEVLANYYLQTFAAFVEAARKAVMAPEYQGAMRIGGRGRTYRKARATF